MRFRALLPPLAIALFVLPACRSDRIVLDYRFEAGQVLQYRIVAEASASWDIGEEGSGSYRWEAEVSERVLEVESGRAVVEVTLSPTVVEEDGLLSPGSSDKTFSLRVDSRGGVLEVLEVDGVPASALDPEEVAFIGTYRPPLPPDPIRLREEWSAPPAPVPVNIAEEGLQQLVSSVRLGALDRDAEGKVAYIDYRGDRDLARSAALPQGNAELEGSASLSGEAIVDIDGGFLRRATTITRGDFEVRALPTEGGDPVTGTLHQVLELQLQRV